jgi:predicted permease
MSASPGSPRLLRWMISVVCPEADRPFVIADLEEEFEERAADTGPAAARRWYASQVVRSLGPCARRRWMERRSRRRLMSMGKSRRSSPREWSSELWADVAFTARSLSREPVVVGVTLASIGLGVGVVTTVFAVANSILLRPPGAVFEPETLVAVHTSDPGGNRYAETSFADYRDIAREVHAISVTAAWRAGGLTLTDGWGERRLLAEIVSDRYFDVLGVTMAIGRSFQSDETVVGAAERVVVISHGLWADRYGRSPDVVGSAVELDGREFTIVGVAPEGLKGRFLEANVDAWVPIGIPGGTSRSTVSEIASRGDRDYNVIGRLGPGSTAGQARAQLDNLAIALRETYPDAWVDDRGERGFTVLMGADARLPPDGRAAIAGLAVFLMAGGGFVLLIACTNVAGLFLARGDRRRREIAVRLSMGADRRRILRLLLTEALVLAAASSAVGLSVTAWASALVGRIPLPSDIPIGFSVHVDPLVAGFSLATACLASLTFGLLPALHASRPDLMGALKGTGWIEPRRRRRLGLRQTLVAAQVAGSLILLVGAGLTLRSLERVTSMDLGLEPDGVAAASVSFAAGSGGRVARVRLNELLAELEADPSVRAAAASALADGSPMFAGARQARIEVPGWDPPADGDPSVAINAVTPGYFELLGMDILRGRSIDEGDEGGAPPVAVVNETFARRYWDDADPLGRSFRLVRTTMFDSQGRRSARDYTVAGVVRGITFDPTRAPAAAFWTSMFQEESIDEVVVHVKSRGAAVDAVPSLDEALRARGMEPSLFSARPYQSLIDLAFAGSKVASRVLTWAAVFTLLLAAAGVFGIVSYSVARRTPEMAIRKALGASAGQVMGAVVRDAMVIVAVGIGAGLGAVAIAAPFVRRLLYGLAPLDPPALLGGTAVLALTALAASWLPTRRIATIESVDALKAE